MHLTLRTQTMHCRHSLLLLACDLKEQQYSAGSQGAGPTWQHTLLALCECTHNHIGGVGLLPDRLDGCAALVAWGLGGLVVITVFDCCLDTRNEASAGLKLDMTEAFEGWKGHHTAVFHVSCQRK